MPDKEAQKWEANDNEEWDNSRQRKKMENLEQTKQRTERRRKKKTNKGKPKDSVRTNHEKPYVQVRRCDTETERRRGDRHRPNRRNGEDFHVLVGQADQRETREINK